MTSREALQKLKEVSTTTYCDEWLSIIEKDLEILQIIKEHFQVCFDSDSDNGLDTVVFNGFSLEDLWEDGYDNEFEKVKTWLEKGKQ